MSRFPFQIPLQVLMIRAVYVGAVQNGGGGGGDGGGGGAGRHVLT